MYNKRIKRVLPPEEMVTDSKQESGGQKNGGKTGFDATDLDPYLLKDPEAMTMNFARASKISGKPLLPGLLRANAARSPIAPLIR